MAFQFVSEKVFGSLVMVVDDTPANLQVVGNLLRGNGFKILLVSSGEAALTAARAGLPDLILLDVSMPGISGIETCARLKSDAATSQIPIIFLTVHSDRSVIVEGFQAGAVDFVPKPFDAEELLSRVRAHLEIKHSRELLARQNEQLAALNREKDEFLGLTSHNLKNPLSGIQGLAELLAAAETMSDAERREIGQTVHASATEMSRLILNLLDLNRIETKGLTPNYRETDLSALARKLLAAYEARAAAKRLSLALEAPEALRARTDPLLLEQLLDNLLSNAIKYTPLGKRVFFRLVALPDGLGDGLGSESGGVPAARFEICDEGPGFSADDMPKLFTKFARLSARPTGGEHSTGLGLSIAKKLAEALGAALVCQNAPAGGAMFSVELRSALNAT